MMEVIPKLMQTLRGEMRRSRGESLSVPQFRVLAAISRGLCHNKEIGDLLGVSEAAISRMLDILVSNKLIKKGSNKVDRRQTILSLTANGEKFFHKTKMEAKIRLKTRLGTLPEGDLSILIKSLHIIKESHQLLTF